MKINHYGKYFYNLFYLFIYLTVWDESIEKK